MNTVNPSALIRSLIVYAICVPLAIIVGYMLTNPLDYQSIGFIGVLVAVMVFPLLMKWHYPLMIFSWSLPATLFFVPGHPNMFLAMVAVSLTISIVERILDRNKRFLPGGGVHWPLLAFLGIIYLTAKLTGGFGLRAMGSDVYGGKKYVFMVAGILSFFALIARPIPKKYSNLYVTLFFIGGCFNVISDLYAFVPSPLHFIYTLFPPSYVGMEGVVLGETRAGGIAQASGAIIFLMLARHGFRDNFVNMKLWRPVLIFLMLMLVFLGGYRSSVLALTMTLCLIFYLEKMHRTGVMIVVVMLGVLGTALLIPMAKDLPPTFQRSLAFLPLDISADVRMDTQSSSNWRLDLWKAILPQVPQHLLLGKGFSFSAETFNDSMGAAATFRNPIDAADDPLALSNDFHSGPLSTVIGFGIWGVIALVWLWLAGFFVVWRNFRYGDPALRHINTFLFASFLCSVVFFLFIFGDISGDVMHFAGTLGFSIALNHGVMRRPAHPHPAAAAQPKQPVVRQGGVPGPALPALGQ